MQRQFSHTRFLFLLIIVLNTLDTKNHIAKPQNICKSNFERDLRFCRNCFEYQIQHCLNMFVQIQTEKDLSLRQLLAFLPDVSCKRRHQFLRLKNSKEKIITKYFFNQSKNWQNISSINLLRREFLLQQDNLQGMQYIPMEKVDKFIKDIQSYHTDLSNIAIWYYILNNIQPLLFPILFDKNFPVPKTHALCGFTIYQQNAGDILYNFFKTDFITKLQISKQLLEAAIQFSYGFNNYRLYLTDFTADNIVYNSVQRQTFFIDLDTIFIVDSSEAKYKSLIHKHKYVECNGCFAYSADEISSYNISDTNIYLTCQFLREDLYKDASKGFLYPVPKEFNTKHSKLLQLLNKCVDCPDNECLERFTAAKELMAAIKNILG